MIIVVGGMFFLIRETKVKLNYFNIFIKPFLLRSSAEPPHGPPTDFKMVLKSATRHQDSTEECRHASCHRHAVVYGLSLLFSRTIAKPT